MQKMVQNFFISANSISKYAGLAALKKASEVKYFVDILCKRRRLMIDRLRRMSFEIKAEPKGAFYILANAKKFTGNSMKFTFELLKNTGVAVTPGIDFGRNAEGYIRFSYANSIENISAAMDRLEKYLSKR